MLNLKLTDEVRNYANRQVSIKNFGVRSAGFNGNRIRQYTGIVGECMVHLAMGEDMPRYDSGSLIEDLKINNKKVIDGKKSTLFKVVRSKSVKIADKGQIVREFYIKKGEQKGMNIGYMSFMGSSEIVNLNGDPAKFSSHAIAV